MVQIPTPTSKNLRIAFLFFLIILVIITVVTVTPSSSDSRSSKLDHRHKRATNAPPPPPNRDEKVFLEKINIDHYLKNERAVKQQIKCLLRNGPCDAVGKAMKKLMPLMVKGPIVCEDCNAKQVEKMQKIVAHLKSHYPPEWEEAVKKYQ